MLKFLATSSCLLFLLGAEDARAADDCSPHCDFWHYYGPYDFSYIRPGLLGYPICDRQGDCAPHLVYTHPGTARIRIIVRPRGTPRSLRP
jgi:hypothetical protein